MLTDPESLCQDVPFHCEEPWIVPGSLYHIKPWFQDNVTDHLKCVANFGLGKGSEKFCEENGGEKIYYRLDSRPKNMMTSWRILTQFGKTLGRFLIKASESLRATNNLLYIFKFKGDWKDENITQFWYDGYIQNGIVYSKYGETMESFTSNLIYHGVKVNGTYVSRPSIIQDDPIVDVSNLTNPQKYCIKMVMKRGTPTHYYTIVDCNEMAYHLCRKTPADYCLNLNSRLVM